MTSWSLTLIVPQKSPNRAKSNNIFHWKLKEDRALIFTYLDSQLAFFDFGHLLGVNWGQSWPKTEILFTYPVSVKIRVFQNALKLYLCNYEDYQWSEFQLNLILFTSYCSKTHQNGHNWVLNQKHVETLLGKDKNYKYTETETWHPERVGNILIIDYVRIYDNPLAQPQGAI